MTRKKAVDKSGLDKRTKTYISEVHITQKLPNQGIAGDKIVEPVPSFNKTDSEKVISNNNNAWVVMGRDRPASKVSGYGGKGDTQAASIDIVAGRMGSEVKEVDKNNNPLWVDPNFKKDAARIYISQKTDIDQNFGLASGKVGNSKTKSGIAMKADGVRIVAREGIKLVTRTDIKNSQGGQVKSVAGIDLIAGNDDTELQPLVKGDDLTKALRRMVHHIDKLNGIVDAFLMSQMEFNEALVHHYHYSPFFAIPTTPAIDVVVPKGIKTLVDQLAKVKKSLVLHKANLASFKFTYFSPAGKRYVCSRYNNTN